MLDLMEFYMFEDCPYEDETVNLMEIKGEGRMEICTREKGIAACTDELAEFYRKNNLHVCFIKNGNEFNEGDVIFEAEGDVGKLFKFWRVSQTFLSITCAIATETREIVNAARTVNPFIIIATTRKTHPGMRKFELKSVIYGGGHIHRNSLSDSILITSNHLKFGQDLNEIKLKSTRKIEIEPRNYKEAIKFAEIADVLLLDHYTPEELEEFVPKLKAINKNLKIAIAGNINKNNIMDFAKFADVIVTSSPYYAKPLDFTTRINKTS